jgi:hypothetical protein
VNEENGSHSSRRKTELQTHFLAALGTAVVEVGIRGRTLWSDPDSGCLAHVGQPRRQSLIAKQLSQTHRRMLAGDEKSKAVATFSAVKNFLKNRPGKGRLASRAEVVEDKKVDAHEPINRLLFLLRRFHPQLPNELNRRHERAGRAAPKPLAQGCNRQMSLARAGWTVQIQVLPCWIEPLDLFKGRPIVIGNLETLEGELSIGSFTSEQFDELRSQASGLRGAILFPFKRGDAGRATAIEQRAPPHACAAERLSTEQYRRDPLPRRVLLTSATAVDLQEGSHRRVGSTGRIACRGCVRARGLVLTSCRSGVVERQINICLSLNVLSFVVFVITSFNVRPRASAYARATA